MSDNNFRVERVKNALDNRKLNLSTPTPGHVGKYASLIWGLYANNPRITVYTNDPNDQGASKDYGKIMAKLDAPVFFAFLELLTRATEESTPLDWKAKLENKNFIFPGGKRSDAPVVVSELWVGKDKEGMVWISIVDRNKERPRIKFLIGTSDFHRFLNADGTPMDAGETSQMFAKGYIKLLQQMMSTMLCTHWVEPEAKPQTGGNRPSYGNNNQGNQGGNTRAQSRDTSSNDEDIPF